MFFGENMAAAQVRFVCWSHAGVLMERIDSKIEARDIAQGIEVTQA